MTRNPVTRNQARDRERSNRYNTLLPGKGGTPAEGWKRHSQERSRRDARDEGVIQNHLEGCSPANRLAFTAFLHHKMRRVGVGQRRKYATCLADIDRSTNGTPWNEWTPDQLRMWTDGILKRVQPKTAEQYALMPWAFLRHQYALQDRLVPNALKLALDVGPNEADKKKRRISDEHFLAILGRHKQDLMYQALLWTLWSSGFSTAEALSLNVGSVRFDDGGTYLTIPPRDQCRFRIKKRAREVWVDECTQAIRDWLDLHPFGGQADAPLFVRRINQSENAPWIPFGPDRAQRAIQETCRDLGMPPIRDHDFRHNRAFRMKKANVSREKANKFFGWSPGSTKYEEYGELVAADMIEDVRRASGSNQLGQKILGRATDAETKLNALTALLGELLDNRERSKTD